MRLTVIGKPRVVDYSAKETQAAMIHAGAREEEVEREKNRRTRVYVHPVGTGIFDRLLTADEQPYTTYKKTIGADAFEALGIPKKEWGDYRLEWVSDGENSGFFLTKKDAPIEKQPRGKALYVDVAEPGYNPPGRKVS